MTLLIKQFDDSAQATYHSFEANLRSIKFQYVGAGAFRRAWKRKNTIIKVPHNSVGYCCNIWEAYAYRKYRNASAYNGEVYAPCRLLPNACLMMPLVQMVDYNKLPMWCSYIDGMQCGLYHGRVVAYDSAADIIGEDRQEALMWALDLSCEDHCVCGILRASCPDCRPGGSNDPIHNTKENE